MWERAALVACLMAEYDVDFASILLHELHDRVFGESTNQPYPCMIQKLHDEFGVPEIPSVYERVAIRTTT